ncbi:hypothetical protein BKA70DRAFT_1431275 [Coprinopsis sp. MPI-PUGE-AT-0042]|nr:hypothetical protein BKA70DRAFT_1431275 [Coprinopsis sp. MPI-PUGE-AT-0042]
MSQHQFKLEPNKLGPLRTFPPVEVHLQLRRHPCEDCCKTLLTPHSTPWVLWIGSPLEHLCRLPHWQTPLAQDLISVRLLWLRYFTFCVVSYFPYRRLRDPPHLSNGLSCSDSGASCPALLFGFRTGASSAHLICPMAFLAVIQVLRRLRYPPHLSNGPSYCDPGASPVSAQAPPVPTSSVQWPSLL